MKHRTEYGSIVMPNDLNLEIETFNLIGNYFYESYLPMNLMYEMYIRFQVFSSWL